MASIEKKSFAKPDEQRTPPKTTLETIHVGGRTVAQITYQPGWRWTTDLKPGAGTDLCQVNHFGYVLAGRSHVEMADGTALELVPGDVATIPAGHDAWVVGEEPFVFLDFGMAVRPA